jgi:hypothetical protein
MRSSISTPSLMQRRRKPRMRQLLLFTRAVCSGKRALTRPHLKLVSG